MGTIRFHQGKATAFLKRADFAITDRDPPRAADCLRRALTHAATALAVHDGVGHNSRRQLEAVVEANVFNERLSRGHLRTFREIHAFPGYLASRDRCPRPALALRRMRRRVSSFIAHCAALIAGQPKPVRPHQRWRRDPDHRQPDRFETVQDILSMPNFPAIRRRFNLGNVPLQASPDPHGFYRHGRTPRPCSCHAHLWDLPKDESVITLSPIWRRALEKAFWIKLPEPLRLRV